ncbi:MAG: acetoin utilization protein AcuC [Gammaproteobacteria bacterium]|nr:acetoin utilization protein AcuC [Gammaproteobacteria bacterium]
MSRDVEVCVYAGEDLARYGFGQGHPFGPDRLAAFWSEMQRRGLDARVCVLPPVQADQAEIERFHTRGYVERVKAQSVSGAGYLDYGDTPAFPGVYEAAAFVVGSTLDALARLMDGRCRRAFVPIAGLHHARRDTAAGFCVFNDCGVAIETLRARHGVRRVAYVDIDAHHGDGVFYGFEDDPEVLFADLHEDGRYLYPGTGAARETGRGKAAGTKLNVPLPPGADDARFMQAWDEVEAFLRRSAPQFILFQCGADSLADDPITHLRYSPAAHARAAERLCRLAEEYCQGRLLAMGGGGYNRANLALAWTAVVRALIETPP